MRLLWAPWRIRFILENLHVTGCVFCSLPKENEDAKNLILARSKHAFVIMNKYPYNSGHVMVVPNRHTPDLSQLPDETLADMHRLIRDSIEALKEAFNPQGFNVGMNLGEAGGAGIRDHLHYHIVPRWNGDTNYLPVIGETKVLPESLDESYRRLSAPFAKRIPRS